MQAPVTPDPTSSPCDVRQVQALAELKKDAVVQEAGLQDEEILALVLYTGWSLTRSCPVPVLRCCCEDLDGT